MVKWINTTASVSDQKRLAVAPGYQHDPRLEELRCSEPRKLDRFWLEFSAVIPRLGGAESDESIEIFGCPEGVHSEAGC